MIMTTVKATINDKDDDNAENKHNFEIAITIIKLSVFVCNKSSLSKCTRIKSY